MRGRPRAFSATHARVRQLMDVGKLPRACRHLDITGPMHTLCGFRAGYRCAACGLFAFRYCGEKRLRPFQRLARGEPHTEFRHGLAWADTDERAPARLTERQGLGKSGAIKGTVAIRAIERPIAVGAM